MNNGKGDSNRVFVLRCWQDEDASTALPYQWHYSVEEVYGGQYQLECSSLGKLVARLRVELDRGARERVLMRHTLVSEE